MKCFHKRVRTGMDSIFRCQFPSAIVTDDLRLVYGKADLDDAFKDKRFMENLKVELLFGETSDLDMAGEGVACEGGCSMWVCGLACGLRPMGLLWVWHGEGEHRWWVWQVSN